MVSNDQIVYLIGNKDDLNLPVKVGMSTSNNINRRLKNLQVGCPFELSILLTFPGDSHTESFLHRTFKKFELNLHGEWFSNGESIYKYLTETIEEDGRNAFYVITRPEGKMCGCND